MKREIDFLDEPSSCEAERTVVETDYARLVFSSEGAALDELEFNESSGGTSVPIAMLLPQEREQRCMLVALDEKTPYCYELLENKSLDDRHELTYRARSDGNKITKKFTVYRHDHRIDLDVTLDPRSASQPLVPRIVLPQPSTVEPLVRDVVRAVFITETEPNKIVKQTKQQGITSGYWQAPGLFGLENKYFLYSVIGDTNDFLQRGYYSEVDGQLIATLEGPDTTKEETWHLSFYCGPKEHHALEVVDPRLTGVLEYGFLAPLSSRMLMVLKLINQQIGNFGWAIILFTILIKLLFLPFTWRSYKNLKKQEELQRKRAYLAKKYRHDRDAMAREELDLFKKHGLGGMFGCLPMLSLVPFLVALNWALGNAIELYRAPFLWISDLSLPDPYYILPIVLAIVIILQGIVAAQQRVISYVSALLFSAFAASMSAGLTLFIGMNIAVTVAERMLQQQFASRAEYD